MFKTQIRIKNHLSLLKLLSKERKQQILLLQFLSITNAFGEIGSIGALIPFLEIISNSKETLKSIGPLNILLKNIPNEQKITIIAIVFITLVVASSILRIITMQKQYKLGASIEGDIGQIAFKSILNKSYEWHVNTNSSKILGILKGDVASISGIIKSYLAITVNLTLILIVGISLALYSPIIFITSSMLIAILYIIMFKKYQKSFQKDGQERAAEYQHSIQAIQESLGGIREVILENSSNIFINKYERHNEKCLNCGSKIIINSSTPRYLIEGFLIILIASISLIFLKYGYGIESQLPKLGAIGLGAYKLLPPVQQCFSAISNFQSTKEPLERMQEYLNDTIYKKKLTKSFEGKHNKIKEESAFIEIKNLSYKYENNSINVLNNINLNINKGEYIALVGATGSGKSTLGDLLLGLLKPSLGKIYIEGQDINRNDEALKDWQARVAHVPQNIYLSDSSYKKNIAFGIPNNVIDQERAKEAARQAQIHEFIETSHNKYLTLVGERGIKLSGGQRQRIGLARALYKKSDLLLLDEATSALDNCTEDAVMSSIKKLKCKMTVIIIAHRLSTIENCDKIIFLDKGEIEGIGKYNEMVENNEGFRRLVFANENNISTI